MTLKMEKDLISCKYTVCFGVLKNVSSELFTVLVKNVLGHSSAKNVCKKGPFMFKEIGRKVSSLN